MSDADLTVSASTHKADRRLYKRRIYRKSMCFYSDVAKTCKRVSQWTVDTVDEINIQIEGDAMYVKAFDDDTIPDTERLSLTYLPDHVHWRTMTADPAKPKSARY